MNKYQRTVPTTTIDVYDILHAYRVDSHAVGHAIKKLLMAGQRGHKDRLQDLRESIQAIEREIDMSGQVGQENTATGDSDRAGVLREFSESVANMTANASEAAKSLGDFVEMSRGGSKPSWSDAPEWANWLAQDANGKWFWHLDNPHPRDGEWTVGEGVVEYSMFAGRTKDDREWRNTLEARPVVPDYTNGEWHEWHGGECPVPGDARVDVVFRSGNDGYGDIVRGFSWRHASVGGDIIRFRVVKP